MQEASRLLAKQPQHGNVAATRHRRLPSPVEQLEDVKLHITEGLNSGRHLQKSATVASLSKATPRWERTISQGRRAGPEQRRHFRPPGSVTQIMRGSRRSACTQLRHSKLSSSSLSSSLSSPGSAGSSNTARARRSVNILRDKGVIHHSPGSGDGVRGRGRFLEPPAEDPCSCACSRRDSSLSFWAGEASAAAGRFPAAFAETPESAEDPCSCACSWRDSSSSSRAGEATVSAGRFPAAFSETPASGDGVSENSVRDEDRERAMMKSMELEKGRHAKEPRAIVKSSFEGKRKDSPKKDFSLLTLR